jgi:hypothetical protein
VLQGIPTTTTHLAILKPHAHERAQVEAAARQLQPKAEALNEAHATLDAQVRTMGPAWCTACSSSSQH